MPIFAFGFRCSAYSITICDSVRAPGA